MDDQYRPAVLTRRWVWKEETNSLEAISTHHGSIDKGPNFHLGANKSKRNRGGMTAIPFQDLARKNDRGTPSAMSKNIGAAAAASRRGQGAPHLIQRGDLKGSSPRPSVKAGAMEHATVTLDDVKSVALDSMPDVDMLPAAFQGCYSLEQFDEFLLAILSYFDAFFERMAIENKPKPMAVEPSLAEKKVLATAIAKQEAAQRLVGQCYCTLVLGLGIEDKHHLGCGSRRNSDTLTDKELYESLYTFATYITYIAFRRQHLELIQKELGRMFRSETFNPAGRPKEVEEVYAMDRLKDSTKQPLTPAEYRRLKPKRPAIKAIINQRSPVLSSLLPTSVESSPWFLDRSKALPVTGEDLPHEDEKVNLNLKNRVGIIGEPMSGFNPLTLAPFGEEQETGEEAESRRSSLAGDNSLPSAPATAAPAEEGLESKEDDE